MDVIFLIIIGAILIFFIVSLLGGLGRSRRNERDDRVETRRTKMYSHEFSNELDDELRPERNDEDIIDDEFMNKE